MSSYITYNPNETVYIKNIGYGVLVDCGRFKTISLKNQSVAGKKDSIYFDPDMFNSDGDSNHSKKSESLQKNKTIVGNNQPKISLQERKKSQNNVTLDKAPPSSTTKQVNIVSVRLEGTKIMVHTPDSNIKKEIDLVIKVVLVTKCDQVVIQVEINKTIDSLKKLIFERLGEHIGCYYNIRLFAVNSGLTELNIPSKTILQCGLKDFAKIVLEAKYAFPFCDIPSELSQCLSLSNGGNTLSRVKPQKKQAQIPIKKQEKQKSTEKKSQKDNEQDVQKDIQKDIQKENQNGQQKDISIAPDTSLEGLKQPQVCEVNQQANQQIPQQQKNEMPVQKEGQQENKNDQGNKSEEMNTEPDSKPQPPLQKQKSGALSFLNLAYCPCKVQFKSGRHYWEIRLDKGVEESDIWIGFNKASEKWERKITWAYLPLGGKKYVDGEWSEYGYNAKPSDTIGVLLTFDKKGKAKITFYRNQTNCGQFLIEVSGALVPIIGLAGDSQVTIESRAQFPLDYYRKKQ